MDGRLARKRLRGRQDDASLTFLVLRTSSEPVTRLRFTLAQLMAIVLFIAFGFAALRNADSFWARATYTLVLLMISAASLGALARKGRARMPWAGFAVFGWTRLLVGALPHFRDQVFDFGPIPSPGSLAESGYEYLTQYLGQSLGQVDAQIFCSLEIILYGLVGAIMGRLLAAKEERSSP